MKVEQTEVRCIGDIEFYILAGDFVQLANSLNYKRSKYSYPFQ